MVPSRLACVVLAACGGSPRPSPPPPTTGGPATAPTTPRCAFETDGVALSIDATGVRTERQGMTTLVRAGASQLSVNAKDGGARTSLLERAREGVERLRGAGYVILLDDAGTAPVLARAVAQKDDLVAGTVMIDAAPKVVVCSFELDAGNAWKHAVELCGSLRAAGDASPCKAPTDP